MTLATVTQATETDLAIALGYQANDPEQWSVYELEAWGDFTWGSTAQALTFYLKIGTGTIQQVGIGSTAIATSAPGRWWAKATYQLQSAPGVTATWFAMLKGSLNVSNANLNPTVSSQMTMPFSASNTSVVTQDTTVATNIGIAASWGSTTGAPTITARAGWRGERC
jgi:hypothetical protein